MEKAAIPLTIKNMTIMNIKHIFSLAALALMTAACSSEDITQQSASQSAQMLPFRATINTSVVTRGLTEATDGKTITAAWVVDEQIALVHSTLDNDNKPIVDVMTVEGVETNGSATIKGTATYINNTEDVYLVYVGHKDNMTTFKDFLGITLGDNSDKTIGQIVDIALEAMLAVGTQDGTLATISDNLDFRKGKSTLTTLNGLATFGNDVPTLSSQFAVWKLSLSDGSNAINASKLEITCGSDPYIDTYTITPASGTLSTFYVLLPEKSSAFKFEATVGTTTYVYTKASVTLEKGKFYQSNITMGILYMVKAWNGSSVTSTLSVAESGTYTVVESSDVDVTWAAVTYVVKDDATIKGDITLTGDVKLILCDGKTLTVNGYITGDDGSSYHSLAI